MVRARRALLVLALLVGAGACVLLSWDQWAQMLAVDWDQTKWGSCWGLAAYWLGHGGVQVAAILAMVGCAQYRHEKDTRQVVLVTLAAFVVSGIAAQAVKLVTGRARPALGATDWGFLTFNLTGRMDSFPSGHVTTSFAIAAVLAARYPKVGLVFYGLASFVAVGRVIGGSHFPSDVMAWAALGLILGWIFARYLASTQPRFVKNQPGPA